MNPDAIKDHGGPAFPTTPENGAYSGQQGMTLRDYFATHASAEDIATQVSVLRVRSEFGVLPDDYIVKARYMHADAMLKARKA